MRILVDEARFLRLAETATVVPVVGEMVADDLTPVMAYARLTRTSAAVAPGAEQGGTNGAFLLESVVGGERWARYSFVGFEPTMLVTCAGDHTVIERRGADGAFEKAEELPGDMAALRALMGRFEVPPADALTDLALPRFWGGAVGYLSYDIVSRFEPTVPTTAGAGAEQRLFSFGIGATVVIFDSLRQTIKVVVPQLVRSADADARRAAYADARARLGRAVQRLRDRGVSLPTLSLPERTTAQEKTDSANGKTVAKESMALPPSSFEKDAFCKAVERCHEHIRAGDIFQVVLAQRFEWEAEVDPLSLYRALRVVNPSPYMFHVRLPDVAVAGASPETLVRVEDGVATLRPIAGTRPRGATREEDLAHEASLLADPKERAEHVMLVDLGRNDLGRIAQTGSVQVTDAMVIERYSHVMHMTSNIEAKLRDDVDVFDVIAATFPAGTLSGAPKVRAMQIIADLEPAARRLYGGAVGYLGFDGAADLAIAIRTVEMRDGKVALQAGAGIVEASDPETEWHETLHKARAGLVALAMAEKASS